MFISFAGLATDSQIDAIVTDRQVQFLALESDWKNKQKFTSQGEGDWVWKQGTARLYDINRNDFLPDSTMFLVADEEDIPEGAERLGLVGFQTDENDYDRLVTTLNWAAGEEVAHVGPVGEGYRWVYPIMAMSTEPIPMTDKMVVLGTSKVKKEGFEKVGIARYRAHPQKSAGLANLTKPSPPDDQNGAKDTGAGSTWYWAESTLYTVPATEITVPDTIETCHHGSLEDGLCVCQKGWTGDMCGEQKKPPIWSTITLVLMGVGFSMLFLAWQKSKNPILVAAGIAFFVMYLTSDPYQFLY